MAKKTTTTTKQRLATYQEGANSSPDSSCVMFAEFLKQLGNPVHNTPSPHWLTKEMSIQKA